jgi:hypothetical protein
MPIDYAITTGGHPDELWSDWFDRVAIPREANGETTLVGPVTDQVALHGLLVKIRDLGLPLIAIIPVTADGGASV